MVFQSAYTPSVVRNKLMQDVALTEFTFEKQKSTFYMKVLANPEERDGVPDDKIRLAVRTRLFNKQYTARKLDVVITPAEKGSTMTVRFHAGLSILLFPISIVLVAGLLLLLCTGVFMLMLQLDSKVFESVGLFIITATAIILAALVPGYFIKSHIHAGNYAINCLKSII